MKKKDHADIKKKKTRGKPFKRGMDVRRKIHDRNIFPAEIEMENEKSTSNSQENNLDCVEKIDFIHGKNVLSVNLIKWKNNSFRIKLFLNNAIEIKSGTYQGRGPAFERWDILKNHMSK